MRWWMGTMVLTAVLGMAVARAREAAVDPDLATILARLRSQAAGPAPANTAARLKAQRDDGSWPDIPYDNTDRARWAPQEHLNRLYGLAQAYTDTTATFHGAPRVRTALVRGLEYWYRRDPKSTNWWYNVIGAPRTLYRVMLLADPILSPEQRARGLELLTRAKLGMTGQNLVWVAEVTIARGCLARNPEVVAAAFERMAGEIRITTSEGIQPDFSFYQHGPQLYSGGYGRGFAVDCSRFAALCGGTRFAFAPAKIRILESYMLEGEQWMIRGHRFDYSACGREIVRKGAGSASSFAGAARALAGVPGTRREELLAFAERVDAGAGNAEQPLVGCRYFYRSDLFCHHRPEFYTSVRMTSKGIIPSETCNGENLHGAHLSDGVNYLYRHGDEYELIFGVWDWQSIPGITCAKQPGSSAIRRARKGHGILTGGVSDGLYGACGMSFEREGLTARKSWFFFDEGYVCLGTDISPPDKAPAVTSINQCLLKGPVIVVSQDGTAQTVAVGNHRLTNTRAVWHDGVLYHVDPTAPLRLDVGPRTGSWHRISSPYPDTPDTREVFHLEHLHESGAAHTYRYAVWPGVPADAVADAAAGSPWTVARQDSSAHIVSAKNGKTAGMIVWTTGTVTCPGLGTVAVDRPCLIQVTPEGDALQLAAAVPDRMGGSLILDIEGTWACQGADATREDGRTRLSLTLPAGEQAGASVTAKLVHAAGG